MDNNFCLFGLLLYSYVKVDVWLRVDAQIILMNKLIVKYSIVESLSCVRLFVTLWAVAYLASLSMGFSRQEYWSGLPCHPPGNLPDPGIEATSPALLGGFFTTEPPGKPTSID